MAAPLHRRLHQARMLPGTLGIRNAPYLQPGFSCAFDTPEMIRRKLAPPVERPHVEQVLETNSPAGLAGKASRDSDSSRRETVDLETRDPSPVAKLHQPLHKRVPIRERRPRRNFKRTVQMTGPRERRAGSNPLTVLA